MRIDYDIIKAERGADMKKISKSIVFAVLLLAVMLSSFGCGPSWQVQQLEEQGKLPTARDFPNTKWVCRELDMYFYTLDYGETTSVGELDIDGKKYRVDLTFSLGTVDIALRDSVSYLSDVYTNSKGARFQEIDLTWCWSYHGSYIYENDILSFNLQVGSEKITDFPRSLTFEKVGLIAQHPDCRWYAEELDMYIESFSDAENYFEGEIVLNGEKSFLYSYEIGNDNVYVFSTYKQDSFVGEELVILRLEYSEDGVIKATPCIDEWYVDAPYSSRYEDWSYQGRTIAFYLEE